MKLTLAIVAALAGGPASAQEVGDPAAGQKVFGKCRSCHQIGAAAKNGVGPQLNGVVDRKIASVDGFKYSPALSADGGIWDNPTLAAFLSNPKAAIPGNRMSFAGLKTEKDVSDVIAYLATN